MRILLTGATGCIGGSVLKALSRTEHQIVCYVRSVEKGQQAISGYSSNVSLHVIDPSVDVTTDIYTAARNCQGLIHCGFFAGLPGDEEYEYKVIAGLLRAARETARTSPVHFLFTTGGLNTGNTPTLTGEDDLSPTSCHYLVKPRLLHEQMALAANRDNIFVSVVRPACIYGGSHVDTYFRAVKATRIVCVPTGDRNKHASYCHVDDVGEFYKRLVEANGRGIYHISEGVGPTIHEFIELAKKLTGAQEIETVSNPWEKYAEYGIVVFELTLDMNMDYKRGREELGFVPRHNFVRDARNEIIW
jgi:nucleoside-diphosphate-sugar epimerase